MHDDIINVAVYMIRVSLNVFELRQIGLKQIMCLNVKLNYVLIELEC